MARGLGLCANGGKPSTLLLSSVAKVSVPLSPKTLLASYPYWSCHRSLSRFFCKHACVPETVDERRYEEVFNRRMAMAGLRPHHRIALGVSGGPDSMALCVLTAKWKTQGLKTDGFIDGLVAIVVDHGLRQESKEEAQLVCSRVSKMGIRCEIARCDWVDGRPSQGHLQEAAREMRYQMISNVCFQRQFGVLLIAHHADDQAELFILRLSRSSGVLGLAGTAFASEIFPSNLQLDAKHMKNQSILLVRPLLDFWKQDMYKICRWGRQDWVEDPTNRSQLFVRNRIRASIENLLQSGTFKSELQAVISECRRTRSFVDKVCTDLINQTVTVTDKGYAVVDLERLNPTQVQDICLSKYISALLQFISQRQRPIRGNTCKLLLNYLRAIPCRTSLTAAGGYLSPAPGSKGTKIIVSCSPDSSLQSKNNCFSEALKKPTPDDLTQIISDAKSFSDHAVPTSLSELPLLDVASESVLSKARELNLLSESTYTTIGLLQRDETSRFITKTQDTSVDHGTNFASSSDKVYLRPGQNLYFMNRFLIRCILSDHQYDEAGCCRNCLVSTATSMEVRHMVESNWLYLAELSRCSKTNHSTLSSQKALISLKSIPAAARRSLPVLISHWGLLLSVPAIGFSYCPCFEASAVFLPRVPLGGGHTSFL